MELFIVKQLIAPVLLKLFKSVTPFIAFPCAFFRVDIVCGFPGLDGRDRLQLGWDGMLFFTQTDSVSLDEMKTSGKCDLVSPYELCEVADSVTGE